MAEKDWCQEAIDLRQLRRDIAAGQSVSETRFGEDMVKFAKADSAGLDRLIAEADRECDKASGKQTRRRYAVGVRCRPY